MQYKNVLKRAFILLFLINPSLKSLQLALPKDVIASVGTHKISLNDFLNRYEEYLASSGVKDNILVRRSVLNNMINELLLFYYDNNKKIFDDDEYQREIKWADKQTILSYLKDQEVYAKITATDEELRDAFAKSNEQIAARHLYAETEEEANNLYQLLQTGADFNELAKQVFADTTLSKNGGYLGYFSWGDMDPAFEDAAYSLRVGEISRPVKTRYGYSIIKLEDRFAKPLLTEDEFLRKKDHMSSVVRIRKKRASEIEFLNKIFDQDKFWMDKNILGNIYNNLTYSLKSSGEMSKKVYSSGTFIKYGKKVYTQKEIEKWIENIPTFHKEKINSLETLSVVLKGLVIQDILFDAAVAKGYDKNEYVKNTIGKYHTNIFLRYKRREVSDNKSFPENEILEYYKNNSIYFLESPQVNLQEIIVKEKSLADSLHKKIIDGADFGMLAEKNSLREWSAKNKGIIGLSDINKFGFLKDTLASSDVNQIIGPFNIEGYYGIFKLLEKTESKVKSFESVKGEAERLLKKERSQQIIREYLNSLQSQVKIFVDDNLLGSAVLKN
ncbi:MAG: peptidylprolyl isomerase [Ignavibacteriales bacterium]|nr:peptidylprolyl isomerase [Ignavibacteriales bacterium]